jgi:hypothetical protein
MKGRRLGQRSNGKGGLSQLRGRRRTIKMRYTYIARELMSERVLKHCFKHGYHTSPCPTLLSSPACGVSIFFPRASIFFSRSKILFSNAWECDRRGGGSRREGGRLRWRERGAFAKLVYLGLLLFQLLSNPPVPLAIVLRLIAWQKASR